MKIAWFITGQLGDVCMHYKVLRNLNSTIEITVFSSSQNIALLEALGLDFTPQILELNFFQALKACKFLFFVKSFFRFLMYWKQFDFAVEPYFWRASARIEAWLISKQLLRIDYLNLDQIYSESIQDIIPQEWCKPNSAHHFGCDVGEYVVIHPFASEKNRHITTQQLLYLLDKYRNSDIHLVGTFSEYLNLDCSVRSLCDELQVTLFLDRPFVDLITLLQNSSLVVGSESFVINLADTLGRRCIGIYSNLTYPGVWSLNGYRSLVLRNNDLLCGPCFGRIKQCDYYCVKSINLDDVL